MEKVKDKSIFHDCFFVNLIMMIPIIDIVYLVYLALKKDKKRKSIALAMFFVKIIAFCAVIGALCTFHKTSPINVVKYGIFSQNDEPKVSIDQNGYLEVGGIMLKISTEDGMILSYDAQKVALYSPDKQTHLVLYQDSGIKVGSLSDEEISNLLVIENPADYFDVYEEKYSNVAEKIGIADKICYATYNQGFFKNMDENGEIAENSAYTEMYILQDIGAETYLSIRIADYTGESPSILLGKYALSMIKPIV